VRIGHRILQDIAVPVQSSRSDGFGHTFLARGCIYASGVEPFEIQAITMKNAKINARIKGKIKIPENAPTASHGFFIIKIINGMIK
jgi:hypothetical protein